MIINALILSKVLMLNLFSFFVLFSLNLGLPYILIINHTIR